MPAGRGKRNQDRVHTRNAMTKAYGSTDAKCHLPCNDAQLHTSELQAKLQQSQQLQQVEHLQQQPMQQLPLDLAACSHWMASAHCNVACWSNPTTPELFRQSDIGKKGRRTASGVGTASRTIGRKVVTALCNGVVAPVARMVCQSA